MAKFDIYETVTHRILNALDDGLRDEQAQVNSFFAEVLEHYCTHMGADAAEALVQWIAEIAEALDQTPAPGKGRKADCPDPNEVNCYYRGW